jgi:hypothetical protein
MKWSNKMKKNKKNTHKIYNETLGSRIWNRNETSQEKEENQEKKLMRSIENKCKRGINTLSSKKNANHMGPAHLTILFSTTRGKWGPPSAIMRHLSEFATQDLSGQLSISKDHYQALHDFNVFLNNSSPSNTNWFHMLFLSRGKEYTSYLLCFVASKNI